MLQCLQMLCKSPTCIIMIHFIMSYYTSLLSALDVLLGAIYITMIPFYHCSVTVVNVIVLFSQNMQFSTIFIKKFAFLTVTRFELFLSNATNVIKFGTVVAEKNNFSAPMYLNRSSWAKASSSVLLTDMINPKGESLHRFPPTPPVLTHKLGILLQIICARAPIVYKHAVCLWSRM